MDATTRKKLEEFYPQAVRVLDELLEAREIRDARIGEITFEVHPPMIFKMQASRCQPGEREVTQCEVLPNGGFRCKIVCEKA